MMILKEYLEMNADRIDRMLHRYFGNVHGGLFRASAHLLLAGGKRLRPAVTLLAADAIRKGSSDDLILAALSLELTHNLDRKSVV